ncbi:pre-rRNA processing and 40S ribosomal subunit assembly [Bulinus truncatus]|nr:pre-rRNA processing and 40S ribosomal subunit assembly [Bulinus truncatus]
MGFGPSDGGGFTPDEIGPSPAEENMDESTASLNTAGMMEKLGVHLRPSDHGASDMASGPSYSSSPLNFSSRMINFTVEYRDKNINVVLADTECVGRIKDVLEDELGIPRDKQELKGLVKRKRIIDDSTILKDLNLPKENTLYLLTPQISNPTVNKAQSQEGEGTSQGLEGEREYLLKVTYRFDSKYRNFSLKFDCQKTVRDSRVFEILYDELVVEEVVLVDGHLVDVEWVKGRGLANYQDNVEKVPQGLSQDNVEKVPQGLSQDNIETVPQGLSQDNVETVPQGLSQDNVETVPQGLSQDNVETAPQGLSQDNVETVPHGLSSMSRRGIDRGVIFSSAWGN